MKKKALSLALALVMCLGLTVPALAANQAGDTTITDTNGTYTLSNSILYTFTQSDMAEINMDSMAMYVEEMEYDGDSSAYLDEFYWPRVGTVYAVPEGTVVTLPSKLVTWTVFDLDVTWENGNCHATEFTTINYPGFTSVPLNGAGYVLTIELKNVDAGNSSASAGEGSGASGSAIDDGLAGAISFYVPKDGATANPFVTNTPTQPQQPADPEPTTPVTPPADTIPASGTAIASTQTVTVDSKKVEFQMYALADANGNLTNYIKLRDMAYVLNGTKAQFAVGYDGTISLTTGKAYEAGGTEMTTPYSGDRAYTGGAQTLKIDGKDVTMTAITLTDDNGGGYNYFKLRDLGKAMGFNVGYSNENGVFIESDKPYAE